MPVDIDGFAVLGAIARRPDAFPAIKGEVVKTARSLVVKQLKDKALTVDGLVALAAAIDREALDLIADALPDAEVKALLAKVDKHNAEVKTASAPAQRKHLVHLATAAAVPAAKAAAPTKAVRPPKQTKVAVERAGNSKAMRARKRE